MTRKYKLKHSIYRLEYIDSLHFKYVLHMKCI